MKAASNPFAPVAKAAAAAAVLTLAALVASPALGQARPTVELRYTASAPLKTPWIMQIERWANAIDEESRGAVRIAVFHSSQLGSEQDTVQQVARGRIDLGGFALGNAALLVPEVSLLLMPLYFKTPSEVDCVLDTAITPAVSELFAAKGVQFIGWGEAGVLDLAGKRPFVAPGDLKGLKAGTQGTRMYAHFWSGLGANPTAMNSTEVASHFQTGLIDVAATVATLYVPAGIGKVAPVLTRLDLAPLPTVTLMNKAAWDKLAPEQQQAMTRARARVPVAQNRQEIRDFEGRIRGMHEKAGGQVVQLTPEQREEWRKAVAPLWPKMVQEAGPGGPKFFEQMEAGRKACEKRG
ncbi:MAG: TRAP transporter substrate-binding protein [Rubrivivax sp.]|nr:TRAP transporter substrate-binding protein [Rubrivivax sp.]